MRNACFTVLKSRAVVEIIRLGDNRVNGTKVMRRIGEPENSDLCVSYFRPRLGLA
jgi:hypothetical protein